MNLFMHTLSKTLKMLNCCSWCTYQSFICLVTWWALVRDNLVHCDSHLKDFHGDEASVTLILLITLPFRTIYVRYVACFKHFICPRILLPFSGYVICHYLVRVHIAKCFTNRRSWEGTHVLLMTVPCIHLPGFSAAGDWRNLATSVTLIWENQLQVLGFG